MNFPKLTDDLAIISKLGDNPGADDGLTSDGLKAKFDEAALILQAYLNGTLVEMLNELFAGGDSAPNNGLNMAGPINMNRNPLQNLRNPEAPGEAVNLEYALAHFLTGDRTINGKPLSTDIVLNAADVGARPDTWLPTPAELGAAPESHVENKQNPHEVNCEQIGAATVEYADSKASMELLWQNASTASTFAGQTLSMEEIGGKKWSVVAIECGALSTLCFVGRGVELFGWKNFMNYEAYAQPVRRTFMLNEDGSFTIGKGYNKSYNGKAYNEDNSVVIPSKLFGIKEATE